MGWRMPDLVGERLKSIRELFGWSQRELAKRAGVPNSAISVIEHDNVSPSVASLEKVLLAFPISLSDFFSIRLDGSSLPAISLCVSDEFNKSLQLNDSNGSEISQAPPQGVLKFFEADSNAQFFIRYDGQLLVTSGQIRIHGIRCVQDLSAGEQVNIISPTLARIEILSDQASWVTL